MKMSKVAIAPCVALVLMGCLGCENPVDEPTECSTDGDCAFDAYCLDVDASGRGTCGTTDDCATVTDPDAYCQEALSVGGDQRAVCEASAPARCVLESTEVTRFVNIQDSSSGEGSCASQTLGQADPGSDLMYIRLVNASGEVIGHARSVLFTEGSNDADVENAFRRHREIFDGQEPTLGPDDCPLESGDTKFRPETVVSMGCLGSLIVEFVSVDGSGNVVLIESGHAIEIGEYGPYCNRSNGGEGSDRYDVYLCTTLRDTDRVDPLTECGTNLGLGESGQTRINVRL